MRKLPVYLLLDTSGSMYGEPIEAVRNGLQVLVSSLRQNPHAMETAFLSVITFSSSANQVIPLTELANFKVPNLEATGATSMGAALELLGQCIQNEVRKTTTESKGDWKPLVFLMTDGSPTDDITNGVNVLKQAKPGIVVACAAGMSADDKQLKQITENVISLDTADSTAIGAFFKWVSSSIGISSQKVDSGKEVGGLDELPPPPAELNIV